MLAGLFLLYLTGLMFAKKPPGVKCMVVNLEYVHCTWNGQGTPEVNYTFQGRFHNDKEFSECTTYISESSTVVGCNQPHQNLISTRFHTFYTKLMYGNNSAPQSHNLKSKVKLNPPVNVTVKNGTDSKLWFYWNHTAGEGHVESEIRHRRNYKNWESLQLSPRKQYYSINSPSSSFLYELQVRSAVEGGTEFWSDWSQPVFWGSNSTSSTGSSTALTDPSGRGGLWTVLYVVGAITLVLLLMILVQHERLFPVVPKPGKNLDDILKHRNVEEWLHISQDLREGLEADFSESPCPVREYSRAPHSASESSDSSTFSTSDQTDFSISISANESLDQSASCSSATSAVPVSSEERQISVEEASASSE